jgi:hypothetical protein
MLVQGQVVRVTGTFRTAAGVLTNPTTVTCRALSPEGTETAYVYGTDSELTRSSTGVYSLLLQLNDPGEWWFRYEGTGAVAAVAESPRAVGVDASHFASASP